MSAALGDHGTSSSRSSRLDQILSELVGQVPEIEAASVVSFDGLAMASALPVGMDEDRVAAMSAALLSLGERAAEGLGRAAAVVAEALRAELSYETVADPSLEPAWVPEPVARVSPLPPAPAPLQVVAQPTYDYIAETPAETPAGPPSWS